MTQEGIESIRIEFPRAPSGDKYWQGIDIPHEGSDADIIDQWYQAHAGRLGEDMQSVLQVGEKIWEVALAPRLPRVSTQELLYGLELFIDTLTASRGRSSCQLRRTMMFRRTTWEVVHNATGGQAKAVERTETAKSAVPPLTFSALAGP